MKRTVITALAGIGTIAAAGLLGWIGWLWYDSRLPDTYSVMDHGALDYGGGRVPAAKHQAGAHAATSVASLRGPRTGSPDAKFTLTARSATIRLGSGRVIEALTFDGTSPGPELRVQQGDLVEVTLLNEDIAQGVTIHWHGVDLPNAEDGVAGVTQNAVLPGERYVYRFRAAQVGTFWYHTHQASSKEVRRGLFGVFVIEPPQGVSAHTFDVSLVSHTFDGVPTINGSDLLERRAIARATPIRLRFVNSDNAAHGLTLNGTPFRVVAIDGTELNDPSPSRTSRSRGPVADAWTSPSRCPRRPCASRSREAPPVWR